MTATGRVPTVGSLFSGIGGFDVAAEAKGWVTRWFCEIDPFCRDVLAHHWPEVPIHGDATTLNFDEVERVDILCAGFPCQPHSVAGKRAAAEDERDLWPPIVGAVRALRPDVLVLENVPGLLTSEFAVGHLEGRRTVIPSGFFGRVLGDLAALGYDARWDVLSAAECGAPQRRERIWIVAYPAGESRQDAGGSEVRRGVLQDRGGGGELGDADGRRREQRDARERLGLEPDAGHVSVGDAAGARCAGQGRSVAGGAVRDGARGAQPERRRGELGHAASGGRGAGSGEPVQRAGGGCESVGDAERAGHAGAERRSGEFAEVGREGVGDADRAGLIEHGGAEPVRAQQRSAERRVREIPRWEDAVPCRGADGTVRLIPRGALERVGFEETQGEGAESTLRVVADGLSYELVRGRRSLWPVAETLPGRVAELRAIGNAVNPAWVLDGAFTFVDALLAEWGW